jgi:uncharacterized protein YjbI with pentapeptide repeats
MQIQTAAKLAECSDRWTRRHPQSREFILSELQVAWEIYDWLSLVRLETALVDRIFQILETEGNFRPMRLFGRLKNFYECWCAGLYMDAPFETLPQKKAAQVRFDTPVEFSPSPREIDIGAGLNVIILLLKLDRYMQSQPKLTGKVKFYACGEPDCENLDSDRLLKIIGYSRWLGIGTFLARVGGFLCGANLPKVNLAGANLFGIDFSQADLRGANLSATNLVGASFSNADLYQVNFSYANLIGTDFSAANAKQANLSYVNLMSAEMSAAKLQSAKFSNSSLCGANLTQAELSNTDLSGAHLRGTILSHSNLHRANLRGAILANADLSHAKLTYTDLRLADLDGANLHMILWDQTTKWDNARGMKL